MGDHLKSRGIQLITRAPSQHARYIERRGALLKDTLHRIDEGLVKEGLMMIPFPHRLSEGTFGGNATLSINRCTPYNAVYGRVPHLLPDINAPPDDGEALPGVMRGSHRLREIAIASIVEGSAKARIQRAANTKTLPAAQLKDFKMETR